MNTIIWHVSSTIHSILLYISIWFSKVFITQQIWMVKEMTVVQGYKSNVGCIFHYLVQTNIFWLCNGEKNMGKENKTPFLFSFYFLLGRFPLGACKQEVSWGLHLSPLLTLKPCIDNNQLDLFWSWMEMMIVRQFEVTRSSFLYDFEGFILDGQRKYWDHQKE